MILCTGAAVEVARLNNFPLMVMTMKMISFKSNETKIKDEKQFVYRSAEIGSSPSGFFDRPVALLHHSPAR
jgi:hypothetical protein